MTLWQIMGASIAGSLLVLFVVIGWIMTDKDSLPCPDDRCEHRIPDRTP